MIPSGRARASSVAMSRGKKKRANGTKAGHPLNKPKIVKARRTGLLPTAWVGWGQSFSWARVGVAPPPLPRKKRSTLAPIAVINREATLMLTGCRQQLLNANYFSPELALTDRFLGAKENLQKSTRTSKSDGKVLIGPTLGHLAWHQVTPFLLCDVGRWIMWPLTMQRNVQVRR
jgi:hypothetical protein